MIDGRSVAEEVYLLVHGKVFSFVLNATLVGAVLGELRLLGRVEMDENTWVRVLDPAPTGFPVLDTMLARLTAEEARSPYHWVLDAGGEVHEEVAARVRQSGLEDGTRLEAVRADLVDSMLSGVRAWLLDRGRDSRLALLGRLLWSAERRSDLAGLGWSKRRELGRATADDWAAMLPRNAWGFSTRGSFNSDGATWWRRVPAPIQAAPRWVAPLLAALSVILIAVAVLQASTGSPRDLRTSGVPASALVKDVQAPQKPRRKYSYEANKVLLEYRYRDFSHLAYATCVNDCPAVGETVRIWHSADDPADIATEWGYASRSGGGNPFVWLPGLAGAVLLLAALVVTLTRWMGGRGDSAGSHAGSASPAAGANMPPSTPPGSTAC